jgi:alanine racemase
VWLKLDSGMHRTGLDPQAFVESDRLLSSLPGIVELTHMTHFSNAEELGAEATNQQVRCFSECHQLGPLAKVSLANSAALISRADLHADWVRPGIMLYGGNPLPDRDVGVQPVMTMLARVIAVRTIAEGQAVGYSRRWISERPSRIATLGVGYGDGYPRHAPNGTPVWINGNIVPLVGCVSMDSFGVDATECKHIQVGDEATLWGANPSSANIAAHVGTINYALLTAVSQRVTREY